MCLVTSIINHSTYATSLEAFVTWFILTPEALAEGGSMERVVMSLEPERTNDVTAFRLVTWLVRSTAGCTFQIARAIQYLF